MLVVSESSGVDLHSNTDPDPAFYLFADPDPDPGQTLKSQKVKYFHEKFT
jgi:hypothetical protein